MLFALVLSVTCLASATLREPPTDDQVRAAVQFYRANTKGPAKPDPLVADVLKDIDIDALSTRQFEILGIMRDTAPNELMPRFRARLAALGKAPDEDGAVALAFRAGTFENFDGSETDEQVTAPYNARIDAIIDAVNHPAIAPALKSGRANGIYWYAYFYSENPRLLKSGIVPKMASLVTEDWPAARIDDLLAFAESYARAESGLPRETCDQLRAITTRITQKVAQSPETDEDTRKKLLEALAAVNSAHNRSELLNRPAPAIHFLWSSQKDPAPTSFKDFAGKVILIDFWATWCGPCIAAFPHLRELQARYKDKPVIILSITSPQGWMLKPWEDAAKRRTGKLTREEELALMPEWVKKMDMTWSVAVTEESCFNKDFGVRGIPSVAIFDAKGIVRHAGLSAFDDTLAQKVDALLNEFAGERGKN
jgi:thiol-disulfide isomerase/thioredoxin